MKVVFLTPTCNKAEILCETLRFMDKLKPQPFKYVFLENNSEDETLEILRAWQRHHPTEIIRLWLQPNAVQTLGEKYGVIARIRQILLDRARRMDIDYAVFVDDDIQIPYSDFITRITGWKKHLVGVPYPWFSQHQGLRLSPLWFNPEQVEPLIVKTVCNGFEEVYAVGAGAMCISQRLLMDKKVNFLPVITEPRQFGEDIGYCFKARRHGYKVYVDGSMLVGHYVETIRQKPWHRQAWHRNSKYQYGKKPRRKGVWITPEKYLAVLAEIDAQMFKRAFRGLNERQN